VTTHNAHLKRPTKGEYLLLGLGALLAVDSCVSSSAPQVPTTLLQIPKGPSMSSALRTTAVVEIAVYTVKASGFKALQRSAHQNLGTFPGFVTSLPLVHPDKTSLFADLILWDSEEAAKSASQIIGKDDRFKAFIAGIDNIRVFAHYTKITRNMFGSLQDSPFVELAGFPAGDETAQQARKKVHQALSGSDDVVVTIPAVLQGHQEGPKTPGAMDLIGWMSKHAHANGPSTVLRVYPELKPLFEGSTDEMPVFDLFVQNRSRE